MPERTEHAEDLARARACADRMWSQDDASRGLGMQLMDVGPDRARVRMPIRADMVNGWEVCHGGLIATLADSTFAVACNSTGFVTLATGFEIDFVQPVRLGDTLVAEGTRTAGTGRSGVYDVIVRRAQDDATVAVFRGRCRSTGEPNPAAQQGDRPDPGVSDRERPSGR